jgi:PPOX class probable FMN-dependent enzyme
MIQWLRILQDALAAEWPNASVIAALATVDQNNHPHVRHVVCREISSDGTIRITSDARSTKNAHIRANPHVELTLWLPNRREQFRIAAIAFPGMDKQLWNLLPEATRSTFFWPTPGDPKAPAHAFIQPPESSPPPANFEVLTLTPQEVDHLELSITPHRRRRWRRHTDWALEDLNP